MVDKVEVGAGTVESARDLREALTDADGNVVSPSVADPVVIDGLPVVDDDPALLAVLDYLDRDDVIVREADVPDAALARDFPVVDLS